MLFAQNAFPGIPQDVTTENCVGTLLNATWQNYIYDAYVQERNNN